MTLIANLLVYNLLLIIIVLLPAGKLITKKSIGSLQSETEGFKWTIKLAIVLVFIMIVSGSRESYVGTDYHHYLDYYNYILEYGKRELYFKNNEIGWEYLNLIFAKSSIPANVFFGLIAGLIWFFFIKASYKFQYLLPLMFFFMFTSGYIFMTFNILRQAISIMIFLYSIKYIIEQKPFHYTMIIFVASLFHSSAIILLPIYLLGKIQFNQKIVFVLYVLSVIMMGNEWFLIQLGNILVFLVSKLDIISGYIGYLDTELFIENEERTSSGFGVILRIFTALFILYMSKSVLKKQPKFTIYFVLFFIGSILSNIFFSITSLGRILNYFNICFVIVMASSIYYSTKQFEKVISFSLMVMYLILYNKLIYSVFSAGGI